MKLAKSQWQDGFTGMLSIRVKGNERLPLVSPQIQKFWRRATSLGSVESLIEHRASIEGVGYACAKDDLLRLSVGIEDVNDLYQDLCTAFETAARSTS